MNTQKTPIRFHTMLLLLMIIAFGALLRFWGIAYDLPYAFNPDEAYIMDRAVGVADGNLRHGVIFRGSLPYYVTGFTIKLASFIYPEIKKRLPKFQDAYAQDKTSFYVIGRAIVASYSILTMIILYLLARALFSETIGLLSVLIFSLNMLEIQYAHQIYSDTALSFFMLFTLYILLIAFKRKHHALVFISAIFVGLSTAQKLPGILLLPFSILIYRKILLDQHISLRQQMVRYVLITGIVIVVYIVSYPFVFGELSELPMKWIKDTEPNFYQLAILKVSYTEKIHDYIMWIRDGSGTIMFLMTLVGAYQILKRKVFIDNFLFTFVTCYLLFIAIGKAHWDNYILPILPVTSVFAAIGLYALYQGAVSLTHVKITSLILVGFLLLPAVRKSVWTAQSYSQPDTRSQEIQWLKDRHIDDSRVARDGYTSIGIPSNNVLLSKLSLHQLQSFDYFVLSSWYSQNFSNERRHTQELAAYYTTIMSLYPKVAEFPSRVNPLFMDDMLILKEYFGKRIQLIRGPTITIYKIH